MDDSTTAETSVENRCDMHGTEALNTKRAGSEAERRAKKAYADRWHKSMGGREQVANVRGYRGEVKEPAYNRPGDPDWRPQYQATRALSDRAPFAHALSGHDPDRVADAEYPWTVP